MKAAKSLLLILCMSASAAALAGESKPAETPATAPAPEATAAKTEEVKLLSVSSLNIQVNDNMTADDVLTNLKATTTVIKNTKDLDSIKIRLLKEGGSEFIVTNNHLKALSEGETASTDKQLGKLKQELTKWLKKPGAAAKK